VVAARRLRCVDVCVYVCVSSDFFWWMCVYEDTKNHFTKSLTNFFFFIKHKITYQKSLLFPPKKKSLHTHTSTHRQLRCVDVCVCSIFFLELHPPNHPWFVMAHMTELCHVRNDGVTWRMTESRDGSVMCAMTPHGWLGGCSSKKNLLLTHTSTHLSRRSYVSHVTYGWVMWWIARLCGK